VNGTEVIAYAERRYHTDAEFHARVQHAVAVVAVEDGRRMTDEERDVALRVAAVALACGEVLDSARLSGFIPPGDFAWPIHRAVSDSTPEREGK
jgi:hypothetical protein